MFWNITYAHHYAMGWNVLLQNSYVKVLILKGDGPFRRLLRLNEVLNVGPQSYKIGGPLRRGRSLSFFLSLSPLSLHCRNWGKAIEDTTRRQPSPSQGESPHHTWPMLVPWSRTSSVQNCEKIIFVCLSHPVYGILLWQPTVISPKTRYYLNITLKKHIFITVAHILFFMYFNS